jgi:hypothetical protein
MRTKLYICGASLDPSPVGVTSQSHVPFVVWRGRSSSMASTALSPTIAERRAEAEMAALQRSMRHGYTALDVSRRTWAALTTAGKDTLSAYVNAHTKLLHAEGPHWPAAIGTAAVRGGVAARALRERRDAHAALAPLVQRLEEVVADVRRTAAELESRREASERVVGAARANDEALIHSESAGHLGEPSLQRVSRQPSAEPVSRRCAPRYPHRAAPHLLPALATPHPACSPPPDRAAPGLLPASAASAGARARVRAGARAATGRRRGARRGPCERHHRPAWVGRKRAHLPLVLGHAAVRLAPQP